MKAGERRWEDLAVRFADLQEELVAVRRELREVRRAHRSELSGPRSLRELERDVQELWELVDAVPYTSDPDVLRLGFPDGSTRLGFEAGASAIPDGYLGFENLFRGPEEFIRDRLRPYLIHLRGRSPVLDIGCGRGELLDLLVEEGLEGSGVDLDEGMVARATAKGHRVVLDDGVAVLASAPDASLGVIFSAQVIEHLQHDDLLRLLELARTKLRGDGVFIAETVNPHCLRALKTFWLDPTHVHPIYPEALLSWVAQAGFGRAEILFPAGTGDLERDRRWEGEFAVVATP